MFPRLRLPVLMAVTVGFAMGCGQTSPPDGAKPVAVNIDKSKLILTDEPTGARGVIDVRKEAQDGDEVVVVGRVGGADKPFVESRASFLIVDPTLKPAMECDCPWDYCETSPKDLKEARLSVKFVDDKGKTIPVGARELFGLKELSTVVVRGKADRDEAGNVTVVAEGLFVRPETK